MPIWSPGRHIPTQKTPKCPPGKANEVIPTVLKTDPDESSDWKCPGTVNQQVAGTQTPCSGLYYDECEGIVLKRSYLIEQALVIRFECGVSVCTLEKC